MRHPCKPMQAILVLTCGLFASMAQGRACPEAKSEAERVHWLEDVLLDPTQPPYDPNRKSLDLDVIYTKRSLDVDDVAYVLSYSPVQELMMGGRRHHKDFLALLSCIQELESLEFYRNGFGADELVALGQTLSASKVTSIQWSHEKNGDSLLPAVAQAPAMQNLWLNSMGTRKAAWLKDVFLLPHLRSLVWNGRSADDAPQDRFAVEEWASIGKSQLLTLSLGSLEISDDTLSHIASNRKITKLDLRINSISNCSRLGDMKQLKSLVLSGNPLTKTCLQEIAALDSLTSLAIKETGDFTAMELIALVEALPELERLVIDDEPATIKAIREATRHRPKPLCIPDLSGEC